MRRFASLMPVMSRFSSYPFERSILYDHDRWAPAALARVTLRRLVDAKVRELDAGDEPVLLVPLRAIHLVRPRPLGILRRRGEEFLEGVDRRLVRNLAARMATHAVRDDVEAAVLD